MVRRRKVKVHIELANEGIGYYQRNLDGSNPRIHINVSRLWNYTRDEDDFARMLDFTLTHELVHSLQDGYLGYTLYLYDCGDLCVDCLWFEYLTNLMVGYHKSYCVFRRAHEGYTVRGFMRHLLKYTN